MKQLIRITESDLSRLVTESVRSILSEVTVNMEEMLVKKVKHLVNSCGGYVDVHEDDVEELQVSDGGEFHGIVSIDSDGVELDNEDFYNFEDLDASELDMIIDYIKWYIEE